MEVNWTYTLVWGLSAIGIGAFGSAFGYDPTLTASISMVGSPVAGIGFLALRMILGF